MDQAPLTQDALAGLLAAAVTSSGPIPEDPAKYQAHMARVERVAFDLADARLTRLTSAIALRHEIRTDKRELPVRILAAVEDKGRCIVTFRPYVGKPEDLEDPNYSETIRTPFVNTPEGAEMFEMAKTLVGRDARIGKVMETIESGPNKGNKVRIAAYIDPAVTTVTASTPAAASTPAPPQPAPTIEAEEDPFDAPSEPESTPAPGPASTAAPNPTTNEELKAAVEAVGLTMDAVRAASAKLQEAGKIGPPAANRPPHEIEAIWTEVLAAAEQTAA